MPSSSTTAQLRPRTELRARSRARELRLAGFLHLNQRRIALIAAGLVALTTFTYSLPATGAELPETSSTVEGQSLTSDAVVATPVDRDAFTVSATVQWPVPSTTRISSGFGYRIAPCSTCSSNHRGADFNPGSGYPIAAIAAGVVREVGNPSGELGVFAVIDHVIDGKVISSVYGHMQLGSLAVRVGDTVQAGEIIGKVGSTGESTGAHLHFGILDGGTTPIDPIRWLRANAL